MKVSISYPDLAFADMFLHVWDHLSPWLEVSDLPVYLNENVICANELAYQRVEYCTPNCPISLEHVYPIQRDQLNRRKVCGHQLVDPAWIHHF
ncbi:hypothetical protein [Massilia yuzhufengensis]|uniref:hypothetical protein n=1 Tax=Massilia yuzhufengensis TaxID=1164594 RepID=UPI001160A54A|nr:hypothetical protein [Massilia yuzhufengensis]